MSCPEVSWSMVCLKRYKEKKKRYALIPLVSGKEVSVGRGLAVTVQLLSRKNPLILSRKHATFKENEEGKWTITDNKSLNGVYLNDAKLVPCQAYPLNEGDKVQIGVIQEGETEAEFLYQVCSKQLNIEQANKILHGMGPSNKLPKRDKEMEGSAPFSIPSQTSVAAQEHNRLDCAKRKREHTGCQRIPELEVPGTSDGATSKRTKFEELSNTRQMSTGELGKLGITEEQTKMMKELISQKGSRTVEEMVELLKSRDFSPSKKKKEEKMLAMLEEKERLLKKKDSEMKEMEKAHEAQIQVQESALMEQLREELIAERQKVESTLQENLAKLLAAKDENFRKQQEEQKIKLEDNIKQKEIEMLAELESQKSLLLAEKQKVEDSLQQEMTRKLEEKDKALQERLEVEKRQLEDVITQKEEEYVALHLELEESRKMKEQEEELNRQKAKQEAFENFTDVMETELQCSICTELFIQATTLNCSHSFCSYCILSWMKRKKECPVCRERITSHNPSIVLDNYIDKMVERLHEDVKRRRKDMIEERKRDQEKNPAPDLKDEIVISSDEDDDDEEEEDSDLENSSESFDNGIPGAYHVEYGDCLSCGRSGHYDYECPF